MRKLLLLGLLLESTAAFSVTPETGMWWDKDKPGTGVFIEVQNDVLLVAYYTYKASGEAAWFIASGAVDADGGFEGPLMEFAGGQCAGCPFSETSLVGEPHSIRLRFEGTRFATMEIDAKTKVYIERFNFRIGEVGTPGAGAEKRFPDLRGRWIFVRKNKESSKPPIEITLNTAENFEPAEDSPFPNYVEFRGENGVMVTCHAFSFDFTFASPACEVDIEGEAVLGIYGFDVALDKILAYDPPLTLLTKGEGVRREDALWVGFKIE